jgi:hypothetical protein
MTVLGWNAGPEQYPPDELLDYAFNADNLPKIRQKSGSKQQLAGATVG